MQRETVVMSPCLELYRGISLSVSTILCLSHPILFDIIPLGAAR